MSSTSRSIVYSIATDEVTISESLERGTHENDGLKPKKCRSERCVAVRHMVCTSCEREVCCFGDSIQILSSGVYLDDVETGDRSHHSLHNARSIPVKETRDNRHNIWKYKPGAPPPFDTDNSVSVELSCPSRLFECDHQLQTLIFPLYCDSISLHAIPSNVSALPSNQTFNLFFLHLFYSNQLCCRQMSICLYLKNCRIKGVLENWAAVFSCDHNILAVIL